VGISWEFRGKKKMKKNVGALFVILIFFAVWKKGSESSLID